MEGCGDFMMILGVFFQVIFHDGDLVVINMKDGDDVMRISRTCHWKLIPVIDTLDIFGWLRNPAPSWDGEKPSKPQFFFSWDKPPTINWWISQPSTRWAVKGPQLDISQVAMETP